MSIERRENRRIILKSTLIVDRLDGGGHEHLDIDVIDVSAKGIGFSCAKPLQVGSIYHGKLTLWTKDTIEPFIEIVRVEKTATGFVYGGIFIGMPQQEINRITTYDIVSSYTEK